RIPRDAQQLAIMPQQICQPIHSPVSIGNHPLNLKPELSARCRGHPWLTFPVEPKLIAIWLDKETAGEKERRRVAGSFLPGISHCSFVKQNMTVFYVKLSFKIVASSVRTTKYFFWLRRILARFRQTSKAFLTQKPP